MQPMRRLVLGLALLLLYVFGLAVMAPKGVPFLTPVHCDFYDYYMISQAPSLLPLSPRPLMIIFLKLIGFLLDFQGLMIVLNLLPFIFILQIMRFASVLHDGRLDAESLPIFVLLAVLSPNFYVLHAQDFGGILAGILFLEGQIRLMQSASLQAGVLSATLFTASLFTKPTFGMAMILGNLVLWFLQRENKKYLYISVASVLLAISVLMIEKYFISSIFIDTANTSSPYFVSLNILENVKTLLQFLKLSLLPFPLPLLLAVLIYVFVVMKGSSAAAGVSADSSLSGTLSGLMKHPWFRMYLVAVSFGVAAMAPMMLIPNRVLPMYAWFGSVFFLLPLLTPRFIDWGSGRARMAYRLPLWLIAITISGLWWLQYDGDYRFYTRVQASNHHIQAGINTVSDGLTSPERVLVSGIIENPWHVFRIRRFMEQEVAGNLDWTVIGYQSEQAWFPTDQKRSLPFLGVEQALASLAGFDRIMTYDDRGVFRGLIRVEASLLADKDLARIALVCPAYYLSVKAHSDEAARERVLRSEITKVIECFVNKGEAAQALDFFGRFQRHDNNDQWYHYWLGRALEQGGKFAAAADLYDRAYRLEPSQFFLRARDGAAARKGKD